MIPIGDQPVQMQTQALDQSFINSPCIEGCSGFQENLPNPTLIFSQHHNDRRQTKDGAFVRTGAGRADSHIGICHQFGHVGVDGELHAAAQSVSDIVEMLRPRGQRYDN